MKATTLNASMENVLAIRTKLADEVSHHTGHTGFVRAWKEIGAWPEGHATFFRNKEPRKNHQ
jgi:hypothetical protein